MMSERGVALAHTRAPRWVPRFMPEFERRSIRLARSVEKSWRVDEIYIHVRGSVALAVPSRG